MHGRLLLRDGIDDTQATQWGTLARDRQPVVLAAESLQCRLTEPLGAAMAEQDKAVGGPDAWWVIYELKSGDRPRVDARASQQGLPDERAVVAGPGADDENTRAA